MDIIVGTAISEADRAKQVLVDAGYEAEEVTLKCFGNEWFVACTPTRYKALSPFTDEEAGMFVLGDPLIKDCQDVTQEDKSRLPSNWRTRKLLDIWRHDPGGTSLRPFHPAALLWLDLPSGVINCITDAWSAVELYYHYAGEEFFVSSSPDLLAPLCRARVDRISVAEYLSSHQMSYPNTLYEGIHQVPPGSVGCFKPQGFEFCQWWQPPAQDSGLSVEQAGITLQREVLDCLVRIREQVGDNGAVAFSSGMDSRYLSVLATRDAKLSLRAVHTASTHSPDTLASRLIARAIGIPMDIHFRQRDHRELVYKKGLWGIGSQSPWRSAHYHSMGLGRMADEFVLDGYMADTVLVMGDPFYHLRRKASGTPLSAPYWDVSEFSSKLDDETRKAVDERWRYARETFNLDERDGCNLVDVYPSARQEHKAQFNSARRNYPIYCPFMIETVLGLGFRLPAMLRRVTSKTAFYDPVMGDMPGVRRAERMKAVLERITYFAKYVFPKFARPSSLELSGGWDALKGSYHKQFKRELEQGRLKVANFLSVDSVPKDRGIPLEIARVLERVGE